jgi:amidohydrolase
MDQNLLAKAVEFRHELHRHPYLSNEERPTLERIIRFLKENTTNIEVVDKGHYVYAVYRSKNPRRPAMAFRSDNDAIKVHDDIDKPYKSVTDGVAHKCGHDGHTATMAAFALEIDQSGADRDVYFLFQPAEENGSGAAQCLDFITDNGITEIFAFHNEPGHPKYTVMIRDGLLCCASKGMIITMTGAPSHASEPENGKNPSFAIAKTALASERIAAPENYKGLVLATIVQIDVGEKDAFGVSASKGKLLMTIRGEYEEEMDALQAKLEAEARKNAAEYGLECEFSYCDAFPQTLSHPESNEKIRKAAAELDLPVHEIPKALRGSEDFGHFTKMAKGAMFFMSYGEDKPMIHTSKYDFDDDLIEPVVDLYRKLLSY